MTESHRLSMLVFGHRGKLKKLDAKLENIKFAQQLLCLRLAVILCHARTDADINNIKLTLSKSEKQQLQLSCPTDWANRFPQSAHLLREEAIAWKKVNWSLNLRGFDL